MLLTGDGYEHRYVSRVLYSAFGDSLRGVIVAKPRSATVLRRIARYPRRYSLQQISARALAKTWAVLVRKSARRAAALEKMLFPGGDSAILPATRARHVVPTHNGPECAARLAELRPDIIAVYGTSIIQPRIFCMARRAALNMHTGISPRYRGADCVFWALHNQEPEWIGTTIHLLDEGIDSGPIVAAVRPEWGPNDDEDTLFGKCVMAGAKLYCESIRRALSGDVMGETQRLSEGREYLSIERTLRAELRVNRLIREGLLQRPTDNA